MAYTSTGTGTSWLPTGPLGSAAVASVSGATVAPGGTVVAIGATAASKVSQQPVFLEAGTDGTVRPVSLAGIAGAIVPEMKINSTAVAGGLQIAVGSANGYPAVWRRTSGGAWTLVSSLGLVAADPHLRALTSVTHGRRLARRGRAGTGRADLGRRRDLGRGRRETSPRTWPASPPSRRPPGPAGYVIVGRLVAPGGSCVADVWWSANMTSWTRAHDVNDATARARCSRSPRARTGSSRWARTTASRRYGRPPTAVPGRRSSCRRRPGLRPQRSSRSRSTATAWSPWARPRPGTVPRSARRPAPQPGAVPFAELSTDGGATWQQVPFSSPGPYTSFTALTANAAGFTAAGLFGQPGQQDVAAVGVGERRELEAVPVRRPQRIRSLADRRADPVRRRGDRHRHHHHPAEPANRHLHPPSPLRKVPCASPTWTWNWTPRTRSAEDEQAPGSPGAAQVPGRVGGQAPGVAWGRAEQHPAGQIGQLKPVSPSGRGSRAPGPSRCAGAGTRTSPPSRPPTPTAV